MAAAVVRRLSGILRPLNFLVPLAYNSSCNIRLISGLSIRCFNRVQAPLASSATKPLLSVSDRSCGCPLSIFNSVTALLPHVLQQPARTLTYYSLRKGKRKSVKSVVYRFLRLHCGLWLRKKAGYKKKLWKKSIRQKRRLREQVFCNKTQSKLLDKMTTSFWKRRNWVTEVHTINSNVPCSPTLHSWHTQRKGYDLGLARN
ncbi:39S ribosomal protein L35, mitochondrial isoform X3 [Chelonia mydas]|uniref:39S ribosomal protein L35, mitochondrial isoform X3 n=1 Tax=Chelonia mydas TaxID=8469 RepID=UPI0018A1C864|nr:39S ribosomal protein L35, mitochondrial isoform X3 [Chelonia mydas]